MRPRRILGAAGDRARWLTGWGSRHRRWLLAFALAAVICWLLGASGLAAAASVLGILPGVLGCVWQGLGPGSYERLCAGPARRWDWRRRIRTEWAAVCRDSGLSDRRLVRRRDLSGSIRTVERWSHPRHGRIRTTGHAVRFPIRARSGQTLTDLETGAERLAATWGAHTYRTWPHPKAAGSVLVVELVMRDLLTHPTRAQEPEPRAVCESVRLGRSQAGSDWRLPLLGRHTLCVGCSGSGKGSVLWGIAGGLAPAVRADLVRLWGVDLKRGVELAMGAGLFSTTAYTPDQAVQVLRALLRVIDERGAQMVGRTRLHQPTVGDPLHVLVIDELAALTAYAPSEVRREAERLLAEILTQGRALGVIVVAFVQDPRKEVVGMRGLFTQVIALRLRSSDETLMVLDTGMTRLAPAHRINPTTPGTGYVIEDSGAVDRVRADYWPDDLIRHLATRYATTEHVDLTDVTEAGCSADGDAGRLDGQPTRQRKPRKPRAPREGREASGSHAAEGAA